MDPETSGLDTAADAASLRLRGYQDEMFRRSMKENVIVAVRFISSIHSAGQILKWKLDGHGKWEDTYVRVQCLYNLTHQQLLLTPVRALRRILAEIDRCPPGKARIIESDQHGRFLTCFSWCGFSHQQ
jgi:hypothetical protein